jgi:hypothetical protein
LTDWLGDFLSLSRNVFRHFDHLAIKADFAGFGEKIQVPALRG